MRAPARLPVCLLAAVALVACGGDGDGGVEQVATIPTTEDPPDALFAPARLEVGAAVRAEPLAEDGEYRRAFLRTFTSATPENAMKWAVVHPERDRWEFAAADGIVSFARAHGRTVRGHPLVWDHQLPEWVHDAPPEQLRAILREHVQRLVRRYRGRVRAWDVVNEPLDDDGSLTANLWYRALGEDYVALAFRWARRADPHAELFLNEISAEAPGAKTRGLVRLVRRLKRAGVPIDGVGLQNHTRAGTHPDQQRLVDLMRAFADAGLSTEITEMDVVVEPGPEPRAVARQADAYAEAARACRRVERCLGITVWGVGDAWSWKGADQAPLLLDERLQPKPALAAMRAALLGDRG